jgi:2'-5' RNA ligase
MAQDKESPLDSLKKDGGEYALWLKPESEVHDILKRIIDGLADEYGAPVFEPHITLASGIRMPVDEMVGRLESVAKSAEPMTLYLEDTDFRDSYFRSLFVRIAHNEALLALRERSLKEFRLDHEPYMPHISLMYKEMDTGKKQQIIERVGTRFDLVFIPDKIHLVRVSGPAESWEELLHVPLVAQ